MKTKKAPSKSRKQTASKTLQLVLLGLVAVATAWFFYIYGKPAEIDLITGRDWSHFAGATVMDDGVQIVPTGLVLTHKDTSAAQPNPPVNVRGPHLKVSGDFEIIADVSGIDNGVNLQLYGLPPVIYDEWRQERGSVRIDATNNALTARVWDGGSSNSMDERTFQTSIKNGAKISIARKNGQLILKVDGRSLGSMPDHSIFRQGNVWFGADATLGTDGWILQSLLAKPINKDSVELIAPANLAIDQSDATTLRNLSAASSRKLPIGVAVSLYPLATDEQYRQLALGQFSMMTIENSMKPQSIHPQSGTYTYADSDTLVDAALVNGMLVHGHALVLGKANAQWMQNVPEEERQQVMVDHIKNVVGHFKGRVSQWDVVNEPLSEDDIDYKNANQGLRKQLWFDAMGEGYIDVAFRAAHEADPNAKLYINEYGIGNDGMRWDAMLALVQRLKSRGVPIDGVGFESHVYHEKDKIDVAMLKSHIQQLAQIGVASRISEIDVLGDKPEFQASQYADVLQVCLEETSCTSYGTWGVTDLYGSTALADRYPVKLGDSLLWDINSMPKQAIGSLQNLLKQH